ncbi:hypothetical protein [Sphingomonas sp. DT-204]|uniref:hypothetical protein n=1 Tax=Sphingomonas sp. DT-204 TaxID=3396166 RepID=UPI003F1C6EB2
MALASLPDRTYVMADAPQPADASLLEARQAVAKALADQGFREAPDARYRLDVGYAAAPVALRYSTADERAGHRDRSLAGIAFCRRQRYVLSVALIERGSGRVAYRNSVSGRRCADAAAKLIEPLAHAALSDR